MNELILDRLPLPVDNHRFGCGLLAHRNVEDRVVARLGVKNPRNLLGVHFDGNRFVTAAIQNSRDLSGSTHAARCILVELALTGLSYDNFRHSSLFSFVGHVKQL